MHPKFSLYSIVLAIVIALLIIPSSKLVASNHADPATLSLSNAFHRDHKDDDDSSDHHDDGDDDDDSTDSEDDEADETSPEDDDEGGTEEPTKEPKQTPTRRPEDNDDGEQLPPAHLDLTDSCTTSGTIFTVINHGGAMQSVATYTVSDGSSGEYQLGWKESKIVTTGFGTVSIDAGPAGSLTVECQGPAALTISAVCVPATGVVFTVRNDGGPMPEPQVYTINNTTTNTFLLGTGGQIRVDAGFGDPVFFSDGLTTRFGSMCKPAGSIMGMIWSDVDGDGTRDLDEPGLGDIEVSLISNGDPATLKTAADGLFFFEAVPGSYRLTAAAQDDIAPFLHLTADPDGELDGATIVNIDGNNPDFTGNFGYQVTQTGSISGIVWLEIYNFGQYDEDEQGLAATTVQLLDHEENVLRTFVVEADGYYEFPDLQPGEYTIQIAAMSLPPQSYATYDYDGELDFKSNILLQPGENLQDVDFGIVGTF